MLWIRLHIIKALAIFVVLLPQEVVSQKTNEMTGTITLKNKNIELQVDRPLENYNFSRFDWTGKIVSVKYKGVYVSGIEEMNPDNENHIGKGFYNEFGIDKPVGFDEIKVGEWFHKIGIGALLKESESYAFNEEYKIRPAEFEVTVEAEKVIISCVAPDLNGYAYKLLKEIRLLNDGFEIIYRLENKGSKPIITNEYTHNFLAINHDLIGENYKLIFPFRLNSTSFNAIVNPEEKVKILQDWFTFHSAPKEQFFYSNLSGSKEVSATWELRNTNSNIGISEIGSFKTKSINLWGWEHVISPELFYDINLLPGKTIEWSRRYTIFGF